MNSWKLFFAVIGIVALAACSSVNVDKKINQDNGAPLEKAIKPAIKKPKDSKEQSKSIQAPKLIVFISIDQWRYDLLERYQEHYQGGFKMLLQEARIYTNAMQDHSATETGPGHSTLLTGVYPEKTGIVGNDFYSRELDKEVYCVEDLDSPIIYGDIDTNLEENVKNSDGVSPKNLLVPSLGDLLKQKNPKSKVYSIAGKDRSAVLMAGHFADGVFWYDKNTGTFATSSYYAKTMPQAMNAFNQQKHLDKYYNLGWDKFKKDFPYERYSRADQYQGENSDLAFPHNYRTKKKHNKNINKKFYSNIRYSPFFDQHILEASRQLIESEKLGMDEEPDILSLGLSATDYIGHKWGPYSQEMLDNMLRLDNALGEYFKYLYQRFGKDNIVIAFSADHGVLPLPEYLAEQGIDSNRVSRERLISDFSEIMTKLMQDFSMEETVVEFKGFYPFFNSALTTMQRRAAIEYFKALDYVEDVILYDDLLIRDTMDNQFFESKKRAFHPKRSPDFEIIFKENYLITVKTGTTHGSSHGYDKHVPVAFMGGAFSSKKVDAKISTVDIAPTLAALLDLAYHKFDGKNLLQ